MSACDIVSRKVNLKQCAINCAHELNAIYPTWFRSASFNKQWNEIYNRMGGDAIAQNYNSVYVRQVVYAATYAIRKVMEADEKSKAARLAQEKAEAEAKRAQELAAKAAQEKAEAEAKLAQELAAKAEAKAAHKIDLERELTVYGTLFEKQGWKLSLWDGSGTSSDEPDNWWIDATWISDKPCTINLTSTREFSDGTDGSSIFNNVSSFLEALLAEHSRLGRSLLQKETEDHLF